MSIWPQVDTTVSWGEGRVTHAREGLAAHRFEYPIAFMRIPLSNASPQRWWGGLFAINRAGIFSFHNRDYGARDERELLPWVRELLIAQGIKFPLGEVVLQTFPRLFGYVFNPVSFWFCHDVDGHLRAVLCEVNNTFGETHNYLVRHADLRPIESGDSFSARKVFHVSPFFPVEGGYTFRFFAHPGTVGVDIEYHPQDKTIFRAYVGGHVRPLCATTLLSALWRFPWMTLMVVLRIHWHALLLWRKGALFHRKPSPPVEKTT